MVRRSGKAELSKAPRLVPGLDVRAGQTIAGKYRVEELLGAGASGVVLSARNVHLREAIVLKILASYTDGQEQLVERRLEKARLASRLCSPHVARILDIGVTEDSLPYVASEALQGRTLDAELDDRGTLPVPEAVQWVLETCEALAEAHAAGLVHGDLKPKNLFLADETDARPRTLKVLDFGTTSPLEGIGDQTASAFFGSPAFVAPEQIQDPTHADARADIWALGVLLYRMVSGVLPFTAESVSGMIVAVVYDEPALLRDAPYELAALVAQCLSKDPAQRPADVKALAAALAPYAGTAGARLSERVAVMLDAPPASLPTLFDASEPEDTGSIAPLSVSSLAGLRGQPATPQAYAPPRARWRTAGGVAVALVAVGLLTWTAAQSAPPVAAPSAATELVAPAVDSPAPVAQPLPVDLVPVPVPDEALPPEPEVSFAPSDTRKATPTPLATAAPIPAAAVESLPSLRPAARTATHVPAGIPTTREALPDPRVLHRTPR